MQTLNTLQARIKAALEQGETLPKLAKRANLHRNTLYGFDRDDWNPTMSTVARLDKLLPKRARTS